MRKTIAQPKTKRRARPAPVLTPNQVLRPPLSLLVKLAYIARSQQEHLKPDPQLEAWLRAIEPML